MNYLNRLLNGFAMEKIIIVPLKLSNTLEYTFITLVDRGEAINDITAQFIER